MLKKFRSWHSGLSVFRKFLFSSTVASVLIIMAAASHASKPKYVLDQTAASSQGAAQTQAAETARPKVETQTTTETEPVPFTITTVNDATLESGKTVVRTTGVNGVKTLTYEVTITDSVQTGKKLLTEEVTTQPVTQVNAIGTKVAAAPAPRPQCDPNYDANRGTCVPIASDVDCAGGSGNGPAYVQGPVYVIGRDIYGLDRDGDGVGCE
ncbi:MAG TPA: G5 domain-containing protein [Candidatus Saccharimonadales bacterium]|nr:G5 domain-containing protein [Candidatus Saccharimonadales bacterium]